MKRKGYKKKYVTSKRSLYLAMKWDYDNKHLPEEKEKQYEELKKEFEK